MSPPTHEAKAAATISVNESPTMLSKRMMIVAAAICVLAMLAYLFAFAEADVAGVEAPANAQATQ